jgi:arginyl-tRNA--protein-N-Asp/Glu arginylyltransferase
MYKASRTLKSITPHQLDEYLSRGWFRMHQTIFTNEFLQEGLNFRDTIWLRQILSEFEFPKWFMRLQEKKVFRFSITDFNISIEHELLYQKYRETKPNPWPSSLESILFGENTENIYKTLTINLYLHGALVGVGFFDIGEKSAAGIVNCYDHDCSKYSPGKFLYLLAIQYCQQHGLEYFYPGYVAPGNTHFDYKLNFHKPSLEFYEASSRKWFLFTKYDDSNLPLNIIKTKLSDLITVMNNEGIGCLLLANVHYYAIENSRWDSPFLIYVPPTENHPWQFAITYDNNSQQYFLFDCTDPERGAEILELEGVMICLQLLSLKHPLDMASDKEEMVLKMHRMLELYKKEK